MNNYTTNEIKIVFIGGMGTGKTSAISAISEVPIIKREVQNIAPPSRQLTTTVAMDYGELTLDSGQKLRLYGTLGQQRFDYMWKIVVRGALGLIILIDNAGADPIGDLARYMGRFREFIQKTSVIIGITHMDVAHKPELQVYTDYLQNQGIQLSLYATDARSQESIMTLIQSLVATLESS